MLTTTRKSKKCGNKACRALFLPRGSFETWCSPECGSVIAQDRLAKAKDRQARRERAADRAKREAMKTISQIEEQCRRIVQKIARIRDRDRGCISCDKPASWDGQWHGSHYRSHGGCSSLQFHLWNINKSCWVCNKLYSGRVDQQKPEIVRRYGQSRLNWLDAQPKSKRFDREYLARFKRVMGKRLRRLEKMTP